MLEYLRNASDKPVAKILMGILIFSFVGWGVADWILGGSARDSVVATVGDTEITVNEFTNARGREMAGLSRDAQKRIYADDAVARNFYGGVLAGLVNNAMVDSRARDLGFVVTDKRIADEIKTFPEFQSGGVFSPARFYTVLNNSGFTEDGFAAFMRGQIMRGYVLGPVGVSVGVPDFATVAAYNARYAMRKIEYVTVPFADFAVGNPTDDDLREYYARNPKILPETRDVSYVFIAADLSKPDIYDAAYARATAAEDAIIGGESLADAARAADAKSGSWSNVSRAKMPNDKFVDDLVAAKMFAIADGTESEILETKSGFVILRVEKINPEHAADFATVRDGLIAGWKRDAQTKKAYLRANERMVDKDMKGAKSVSVSRADGAPTDVLVAAFAQPVGTTAIVQGADAFYVLRVAAVTTPKMDTVKRANLTKELKNMTARQLMDDYNAFLQRRYKVEINEKTFERFIGN